MDTSQTIAEQQSPKFKTTLYLTESNRRRLERFNKGTRTKLINQAIAEKLEQLEKEALQEKLLNALEHSYSTPSNDISTEDALHEIRTKELINLVNNQ